MDRRRTETTIAGPDGARIPRLGDRAGGVLLHPTSLPGPRGGDLGREARRFIDFLESAGQRWWQMLPVGPPGYGGSPYSAHSAFAGSEALISIDALAEEGLLDQSDLAAREHAVTVREELLSLAHAAFTRRASSDQRAALDAFCRENEGWLEDYALYTVLKRAHGGAAWTAWPEELRDRHPRAMAEARQKHAHELSLARFTQHVFARQFAALRAYAAERGVGLIGDIPIFVAHDSADVWQSRELYRLDAAGEPTVVAGVPPDYFSATGQRWGNPLYRWRRMEETGYAFWIDRLRVALTRFDAVRLDHFIGLLRNWEIPAACPTAEEGRWIKGPGARLLEAIWRALGRLPLIAEDLGAITPRVKALRKRWKLPGIRVLQFAFGDDPSAPDFLPHNYPRRAVVYTGTHDNDTTVGWFNDPGGRESTRSPSQIERERRAALAYLGSSGEEIHWDMIRAAWMSVAATAIVPVQDLLGLGAEARMNRPGEAKGNWSFRLPEGALDERITKRLLGLTRVYGRLLPEDRR